MMATARKIPAPAINAETKPFWDAAANGQLLVKKCLACGEVHYYPRTICPFCHSDRTEWLAASGQGTIYSYSVMRRAAEPYAIAYVALEEGATVLT
ncbi:MAG: Zn-ribbon domain-containing OB-fold protein, partial [Stellaceae bacterium]